MLFQPEHIDMIKEGKKVETRRDWKRKQVKEGGVYPCQTEMFQPKSECDTFIKVRKVWKEQLSEINKQSAFREGHYTVDEFKELWEDINEEWRPDNEIYAVNFRVEEADRTLWQKVVYNWEILKNFVKSRSMI